MINTQKSPGSNLNKPLFGFHFVTLIFLLITLLNTPYLQAQDNSESNDNKKIIQLNPDQLKAFEGYFQNSQNKDMVVQFTARENSLNAKLSWNDAQIKLFPDSAFEFFSKEGEPITIQFGKGKNGVIDHFAIRNNGLWTRVDNYKPLVRTEISHTPEQLKVFEGVYQLQNQDDRFIQFSEKDNKLILKQQWDGEQVEFVPDSALSFFSKQQKLFTLQFVKGDGGNIAKVIAFRNDVWIKLKKTHLSPEQLKIFEGKYRFKDDQDDIIQIKVQGDNLVVTQLWDGKETTVYQQTENYFYNEAQSYPVAFAKDKDGSITQVVVLDGDLFEKIKK